MPHHLCLQISKLSDPACLRQEVVQVGVIQGGDTMQALLRLMSNLYAPHFIASSLWPESIKKDFVGELANHPCYMDAHAGHLPQWLLPSQTGKGADCYRHN